MQTTLTVVPLKYSQVKKTTQQIGLFIQEIRSMHRNRIKMVDLQTIVEFLGKDSQLNCNVRYINHESCLICIAHLTL